MESHQQEREIKAEQHHVPPDLPQNPEALEHDKRQMANLIPIVVVALAIIFVILALIVIL